MPEPILRKQQVDVVRMISLEICIHHILEHSSTETLPSWLGINPNPCYMCIPDIWNRKCPRYKKAELYEIFQALDAGNYFGRRI